MAGLTLHPMKEIRVIVSGENRPFVTELLDKVEATGYTIIGNLSGKGHHGFREAHFMFSEQESLVMIMAVVPEGVIVRGAAVCAEQHQPSEVFNQTHHAQRGFDSHDLFIHRKPSSSDTLLLM